MRMCHFWAQNGPFARMRIFSENLKRRLKNTEISLAESHFWLYLENEIFPKHAVFAEC